VGEIDVNRNGRLRVRDGQKAEEQGKAAHHWVCLSLHRSMCNRTIVPQRVRREPNRGMLWACEFLLKFPGRGCSFGVWSG
jgi:hypothetical protein